MISVLVICSLPQLIIAAFAAVFITDVSNPSVEMFGHSENVVSIENFSSMKIVIVRHLLELIMVAEFSHRCEKLTK
jgi:hypothetical protein